MPSGRDSFRRNRVAPFVLFYFTMSTRGVSLPRFAAQPVTAASSFSQTTLFFQ